LLPSNLTLEVQAEVFGRLIVSRLPGSHRLVA